MATIDWIIIGILGISTLISIRRGFIKEALSLLTWIAAVIISRLFAGQFSVLLEPHIETATFRLAASYLILFIGTLMVGGMINHLIGEVVKLTGLSGTDKFLGMFFGLARGGIVVLLVVAGIHYIAPEAVKQDDWYQSSMLIPEFVRVVEELGPLLWEQGEQMLQTSANVSEG